MLNDEESYRRYKQHQNNKYRYKQEQITFPITIIIALMIFFKYWHIILSIGAIILTIIIYRKMRCRRMSNSTEQGFINKRNQRNNGCTYTSGTDHNQKFYSMECLNCGHKYQANGSDIWQRKCPKCQGGKP